LLKELSKLTGANIVSVLAAIFQILFFATVLTQEQYGYASYLVAISIIISAVGSENVRITILRGKISNFAKSIVYSCAIIFVFCTAAQIFVLDEAKWMIFITLLVTSITQAFVIIIKALFTTVGAISTLSRSMIISVTFAVPLSVLTTLFYTGDFSLLLFYLYNGSLFLLITCTSTVKNLKRIRLSQNNVATPENRLQYLANSAMGITLVQSPIILGNAFLSPQMLGVFALSLRIIEITLRLPVTIINTILASNFNKSPDGESYIDYFSKVLKVFMLYIISGTFVLLCTRKLNPGINEKIDAAIAQFDAMALIHLMLGFSALLFQHYLLLGKLRIILLMNAARIMLLLFFLNFNQISEIFSQTIISYVILDTILCYMFLGLRKNAAVLIILNVFSLCFLELGLISVIHVILMNIVVYLSVSYGARKNFYAL